MPCHIPCLASPSLALPRPAEPHSMPRRAEPCRAKPGRAIFHALLLPRQAEPSRAKFLAMLMPRQALPSQAVPCHIPSVPKFRAADCHGCRTNRNIGKNTDKPLASLSPLTKVFIFSLLCVMCSRSRTSLQSSGLCRNAGACSFCCGWCSGSLQLRRSACAAPACRGR